MSGLKKERVRLTQERLKELLHYDPETGIFTRVLANTNRTKVGDIVGALSHGYKVVGIDCHNYQLHILAFLYMEGYLPEYQVDHIDRNPSNNIWSNLRHVRPSCNMRNCGLSKLNTSGVRGISKVHRHNTVRWRAYIHNYDTHTTCGLGYHKDFTEAVCHRYAAEQMLDWLECDTRSSAYLYLKEQGIIK